MPEIGRPNNGSNKFSNIKMAKEKGNIGKILNGLNGQRVGGKKILAAGEKHNQLGKNEFLKLLTFQMKNQDPMKPQDPSKITGDLAQFAQLEQVTNMREEMKRMNQNQPNQLKYMAASFVGKKVTAAGNTVNLKGEGKAQNLYYSLEEPASKVIVRVIDKTGGMVREIEQTDVASGLNTISWDGKANDGTYAGNGEYKVWSVAWNEDLERINIDSKTEGLVTDVTIDNGEAILTVSGKKVNLHDVSRFQMGQDSQKEAN